MAGQPDRLIEVTRRPSSECRSPPPRSTGGHTRWPMSADWASPRGVDTLTRAAPGKESIMGQQRRRFSPEFKRDAIALYKSSGRSIAAVAKELGLGESNLGSWLAKDREQRAMADAATSWAAVPHSNSSTPGVWG
jgi:Transposase